jgi:hypothetical protein
MQLLGLIISSGQDQKMVLHVQNRGQIMLREARALGLTVVFLTPDGHGDDSTN